MRPKSPQIPLGALGRAVGEPDLEVRLADLGLQRRRRALGDDLAAGDDPDPVGELVGLLEVLGGEEDGRALAVERRDLLPDRLAADRVEAGGRLVEEQHLRLVDERRGEVEAPAHAARVGADAAVGGLRSSPTRSISASPRRSASRADQAVQRRLQADQLAAGHQRVERRLLQRDADRAADVGGVGDDVVAGDPGAAAGRAQQRGQHPHGGRLAGAVGAEEGVDLAVGDLEVDAVDGPDPARELAFEP